MKIIKRIFVSLLVVITLLLTILGVLGFSRYKEAIEEQPLVDKVNEIRKETDYVKIDSINPNYINAVISIEDKRFYDHSGVDYIALCRVLLTALVNQEINSGGSTITQQLGKNLYFGFNPDLVRKVSEIFVAKDLEKNYTKDEILELYINIINFGDNNLGIKQAANNYFNVDPSELNLAQASMLAGLPQSPANYQLSNNYSKARIRQKEVLNAMVKEKVITKAEADKAYADEQSLK
ncbi:MAG: biosynthetic peptidoglycan transglycosylase [Erysipelotrichaceae bacterium]